MLLLAGIVLYAAFGTVCSTDEKQDVVDPVIGNTTGTSVVPPSLAIVSGLMAYPGQHPHQAAVRMVGPGGGVSGCGGVVVHHHWLLSAAHCTTRAVTIVVRAGLVNLTMPAYFLETTEWHQHPTYDDARPSDIQPHDISIIRVPQPFVFSRILRPISLQPAAIAYRNYDQEVMHVSGFGRIWTGGVTSEILQWVFLRAISNEECHRTFGSIVTRTTICAKYYDVTSQSPCQGDNGGALVQVSPRGDPTLIGISVFMAGGEDGCHSGHPAGFLRVGAYHEWLTEVTGVDFEDQSSLPQDEDTIRNLEISLKVKIKVNDDVVKDEHVQIVT